MAAGALWSVEPMICDCDFCEIMQGDLLFCGAEGVIEHIVALQGRRGALWIPG